MSKEKIQRIQTQNAPQAIGPYSQALIISSNEKMILVSGQLPIDPSTGELIRGNIQLLTKRVLDNIEAILIASRSSLEQIIRTDIFLTNMQDFPEMNAEYAKRVSQTHPPARQTVEVRALPKGASIEISCIAMTLY